MKKKIAILGCDNVKNDLNCSAAFCFQSFNGHQNGFARYNADQELELVGFSNCSGCPTMHAPEKILRKIKPLVEMSKADIIHFSSCMVYMCPFIQKYKSVINANYPNVEVVLGTDSTPDHPQEMMQTFFKNMIIANNADITEEGKKLAE